VKTSEDKFEQDRFVTQKEKQESDYEINRRDEDLTISKNNGEVIKTNESE
jgi:hypothetical protein